MDQRLESPLHLNPREAAKFLRLPTKMVRSLLQRKEMPGFKLRGKWHIPESELAKWIQGNGQP
jgi:excisionase family DNA binding protein